MKTGFLTSCILVLALALGLPAPRRSCTPPPRHRQGRPFPATRPPILKALQKYTKQLETTRPGDPSRGEGWRNTVGSAVQLGEFELAEKNLNAML